MNTETATSTVVESEVSKISENISASKVSLSEIYAGSNVRSAVVPTDDEGKEEFEAFCDSIKSTGGIITPLAVVEIEPDNDPESESFNGGKKFGLTNGGRRYAALKHLSVEEDEKYAHNVPINIFQEGIHSEESFVMIQLVENIQRVDLNKVDIAKGIKDALDKSKGELNQDAVGRILGLSKSQVSQYLTILKLPVEVQEMINNGEMNFTNARTLATKVPKDRWESAIPFACSKSTTDFNKWVEGEFGEKKDEEGGDGTKQTSGPSFVGKSEVEKFYLPWLQKQVKETEEKKEEKTYSLHQVRAAQLDAVRTLMGEEGTQLLTHITPFKEKVTNEEEAEKADKKSKDAKEKFFRTAAKQAETMLKDKTAEIAGDPSRVNETPPTLSQCQGSVVKSIMDAAGHAETGAKYKEELGFECDFSAEVLAKLVLDHHAMVVKDRAEAKANREETKAKKEAEEKAAADKAAAEAGDSTEAATESTGDTPAETTAASDAPAV